MFSLMRKRNEGARQKKMDHLFSKADDNGNGKITPQQMIKLFAANDIIGNIYNTLLHTIYNTTQIILNRLSHVVALC